MKGKTEFLKKLNDLVTVVREKGNQITVDEVRTYFSGMDLNEEQIELVFDYLLAQKVVVKGYIKMDMPVSDEAQLVLTEDEEAYLKEYQEDLKAFNPVTEREELFKKMIKGDSHAKNRIVEMYLKDVIEIAKEMYHPEIFLGDLIQEGNVGLILGTEMVTDAETAHQTITEQIRQSIQMLIEEHTELSSRDKKMVEKVEMLDESIKTLTEELGRKVTIDELAIYMGMTEDEIDDILKLTGEETEE